MSCNILVATKSNQLISMCVLFCFVLCILDEMMFTCAWYHRPQDVLSAEIASFYGEVRSFLCVIFYTMCLTYIYSTFCTSAIS